MIVEVTDGRTMAAVGDDPFEVAQALIDAARKQVASPTTLMLEVVWSEDDDDECWEGTAAVM